MSNITEAITRFRVSAAGFTPSAHAAARMSQAAPAYKTLVVDARNDAQGAKAAWSPPVE